MLEYLVADDERMIRIGVKLMIEDLKLPIECIGEAKDGLELLELLEITKPTICFVDIKMPNKDGLETIREGIIKSPNTYWVILTGFSKFEYAKKAIELGVTEYLLKPIIPEELEKTVYKIIRDLKDKDDFYQDKKLIEQNTALQENSDIVGKIKEYVNENYMYDMSITTLATEFNMTTAYMSRVFHQKSGEKFIDYLIKVRMKNAKRIMELNPTIPIREVAEMVGYYSTRYFTKIFVKIYGYYPSEFKKTIKMDN